MSQPSAPNFQPDSSRMPCCPIQEMPLIEATGDDVTPDDFVAFWFDGTQGLYINPGIWHEGVFPVESRQRFFDKQGKVHARINVDFVTEFQCYLSFPLESSPRP